VSDQLPGYAGLLHQLKTAGGEAAGSEHQEQVNHVLDQCKEGLERRGFDEAEAIAATFWIGAVYADLIEMDTFDAFAAEAAQWDAVHFTSEQRKIIFDLMKEEDLPAYGIGRMP